MHAYRLTAVTAAVTAALLALAAAPSQAQTPTAQKQQRVHSATSGRAPVRVTVRRRSYLDPGTETKAGAEHYMDYAFQPGGNNHSIAPNDWRVDWTRMPFPSCFDLAGFCR